MASFDFIDATNKGYGFVWKHRILVAKLAFFPVIVKCVCLFLILAFDLEQNILRSGLIMIPAYFLEGWLLSNLLRIAFFSDIGARLSGNPEDDEKMLKTRGRDVMAGTVMYVLLKLGGLMIVGAFGLPEAVQGEAQQQQDPSLAMFLAAFAVLVAFVWLFRVYFLYIPVSLGYGVREYFKTLHGFRSSFSLIAGWIMCFLPLVLLTILGFDLLKMLFNGGMEAEPTQIFEMVGLVWRAVMEVAIEIMVTMTLGHGIVQMMSGTPVNDRQGRGS